jgi:hypothetical protein
MVLIPPESVQIGASISSKVSQTPYSMKKNSDIAFGALEAGLEVEYSRDSIGFRWFGSDEGDQVEGEGDAEFLDEGTIQIEFSYRNGDEAVLKAKRESSSTAC